MMLLRKRVQHSSGTVVEFVDSDSFLSCTTNNIRGLQDHMSSSIRAHHLGGRSYINEPIILQDTSSSLLIKMTRSSLNDWVAILVSPPRLPWTAHACSSNGWVLPRCCYSVVLEVIIERWCWRGAACRLHFRSGFVNSATLSWYKILHVTL